MEAEEAVLLGRCEEVQVRLEEEQWTVGELQQELGEKGALVRALRCSLRDEERRFLQELQLRSQRGAELRTQLRIQTEAAAYLALQLHSARHNLHQQHLQWPPQAPPTGPQAPPICLQAPPVQPLAPPPAPEQRHALRAERARECVPRERVTAPADPAPMPDPALFLPPRRNRPRPLAEQTDRLGEGRGEGWGEREDRPMGEGCCGIQIKTANSTGAHQPGSHANYANESSPGDLDHSHQQ